MCSVRIFFGSALCPRSFLMRTRKDGLYQIGRHEGLPGLYKGTVLALIGVSNGAIQFMTYEEFKRWGKDRKRRKRGEALVGERDTTDLSNLEYMFMSGSAKLVAIGITYPYQVVRSRMQNQLALSYEARQFLIASSSVDRPYTSIPDCIIRTFRSEGLRAFYKGLWPSAIRVLPGTCVTFVRPSFPSLSRHSADTHMPTGRLREFGQLVEMESSFIWGFKFEDR